MLAAYRLMPHHTSVWLAVTVRSVGCGMSSVLW